MSPSRICLRASLTGLGLAAVLSAPVAMAQTPGGTAADVPPSADTSAISRRDTGIDDSGKYAREVQACLSGQTQQARDTCLEEARNAQAAQRRGELGHAGENYTANATARCQPLTGEFRAACEARVMGFGSSSGSVAGGGVLREVEIVVLPPGADRVRVEPKTANPVVLVPAR